MMRKGWRNDPGWVIYRKALEEERQLRMIQRLKFDMQLRQMQAETNWIKAYRYEESEHASH